VGTTVGSSAIEANSEADFSGFELGIRIRLSVLLN
jgi:hypothetical protein